MEKGTTIKVKAWDVEHDIIRIGNLIGCDLCKKGDEIRNNPVCVPKMTAFRLSARTEVLNELLEKLPNEIHNDNEHPECDAFWKEELSSTAEALGFNRYRSSVTDIIKGMMNEK